MENTAGYSGVNVENAAYPQGWCAEASALSAMVVAGETELDAVAVMATGSSDAVPVETIVANQNNVSAVATEPGKNTETEETEKTPTDSSDEKPEK